jgi:5'-methylthioadenosine phosphorylase
MTNAVLGIIGGSGIYDLRGWKTSATKRSAARGASLRAGPPRHHRGPADRVSAAPRQGHRLSPSDINYRANIDVAKRAGSPI